MSHAQIGSVVVALADEETRAYEWATSVRVDRKGTLHIHGPHGQHIVHLVGEWLQYAASSADVFEITDVEEDEDA